MNCPLCQQTLTTLVCPTCDPSGDAASWLELHKLAYIRGEISRWPRLGRKLQADLKDHYEEAQRSVEIKLGLRQAPPTAAEAKALEYELAAVNLWLFCLDSWAKRGWLAAGVADPASTAAKRRRHELLTHLHQAAVWPLVTSRQQKQRDLNNFAHFVTRVDRLVSDGQVIPGQGQHIYNWLDAEIAARNAELYPHRVSRKKRRHQTQPKATPAPKPANTIPWSRDQLWETLLSERTLQAILFLGALLVVAAGISWVAWNWETFSPPLQVGILAGITAAFFGAGWHVHGRLALRGSGVALIGVGALLVPLDIYALHLSGLFPAGAFPWLWLAGSAICLLLYFIIGWRLQAPFFGYLLAAAAGSLAVAALNLVPDQLPYWSPVTMVVALVLAPTSRQLARAGATHRTAFLTAPLLHSALGWATAILLVGTIYEGINGGYQPDDQILLALNFAAGALTFAAGRRRYRWLSLLGATLVCLPLAGLWAALWGAEQASALWPWLGPAWAVLMLCYLYAAWRWPGLTAAERRLLYVSGGLLGPAALAWSLTDLLPATVCLLSLAAAGPLLARARAKASWLWLLTAALLLAGATWQGYRGATAAALALPWTLLATLLLASALMLKSLQPTERAPLIQSSMLVAFLAVLPPLMLADRALLIYTVANWCGLTLWHLLRPQVGPGDRTARLAAWGLAAGILLELWLLATRAGPPAGQLLALAYALLAWGYLALAGLHRGQSAWRYLGLAALFGSIYLSLDDVSGILRSQEVARSAYLGLTVILYNGAIYSLTYAWRFRRRGWLYLAGSLYGLAAVPILFLYLDDPEAALLSLSLLPGGSLLMLLRFSQSAARRRWLQPLAVAWLHLTLLLLPLTTLTLLLARANTILPRAIGVGSLGLALLAYGWHSGKERWHHLGLWTGILAGGAVVRFYSQGTGRSAALAALLAILLIAAERALHQLAQQAGHHLFQRGWQLYRRPLTLAGWLVAGGAALAALGRNLHGLGGGPTQVTWSFVTLALLAALLLAAARWYPAPALNWPGLLALTISWTLLTHRLLPPDTVHFYAWFGSSWLLLALWLAQAAGSAEDENSWRYPAARLAHLLVPAGILCSLLAGANLGALLWPASPYSAASSLTLALATLFYFQAYRRRPDNLTPLYFAAFLSASWLFITARTLWPALSWAGEGLLLLATTLPALWLARRLERRNHRAAAVFYHLVSLISLLALPMLAANRWLLGLAFYYLAGLAVTGVAWHRQPRWLYVAGVAATIGHGIMLEQRYGLTLATMAWSQLMWAALLILCGRFLRRRHWPQLEPPLLAVALALLGLTLVPGLLAASPTRQLSSAGVALLLALIAYWQNGPLYLYGAIPIGFLAYLLGLAWFPAGWQYPHLYALPVALLAWLGANWLDDQRRPALGQKLPPYDWDEPVRWWAATWERLLSWWSLPFYALSTIVLVFSSLMAPTSWHGLVPLALTAVVWANLRQRSRMRIWLFTLGLWLQWFVFALIRLWLPGSTIARQLLATSPAALVLLWAAARIGRRDPWGTATFWRSQALPLWALLGLDMLFLQAHGLDASLTAAALTLLNSCMLGIWAYVWHRPELTYASLGLLGLALAQFSWASQLTMAQTLALLALLALGLGTLGHGWRLGRRQELAPPGWLVLWAPAARHLSWLLGSLVLLLIVFMLPEAFLGLRQGRDLTQRYLILSLAESGLLWLIIAATYQRVRLAYAALLVLLGAWLLAARWWLPWEDSQLFALPAGLYLLTISWLEWTYGQRRLAIWLERAGLCLMLGAAFWQSFGPWGGLYSLLMIVEGLLLVWLGSWRRLRRLLYTGVSAVILAVAGQLVEPLLALNSFVLLLLGAGLVGLGVALERRLEKLRGFSKEVRQLLESWE